MTKNDPQTLCTPTMAGVLEGQGYFEEARRIYSELLEKLPGHPAYRVAVERLEGLLIQRDAAEEPLADLMAQWLTLLIRTQGLKRLRQLK